MWFKICKSSTITDEDVLFGVVYIPPSDSRFNKTDETDFFEINIINACIHYKYVYVMGDFNSRTHTSPDFIDAQAFFMDYFDLDNSMNEFFNVSAVLTLYNLAINRRSKDSIINTEGQKLLELCKSNYLTILNGRFGQDRHIGNFTYRNISVIDYTIASKEAHKYLEDFCITELECLYSDGYSMLSTTIKFKNLYKKIQALIKIKIIEIKSLDQTKISKTIL